MWWLVKPILSKAMQENVWYSMIDKFLATFSWNVKKKTVANYSANIDPKDVSFDGFDKAYMWLC